MRIEELHPDGTYAVANLTDDSKDKIYKLIDILNLKNRVPKDKLHTTVMYSTKPCPTAMEMNGVELSFKGKIIDLKIWDNDDETKCLVAKLNCYPLENLHKFLQAKYNATYDFPEYIPHITLSYNCGKDFYTLPTYDDYIVEYTTLNIKPIKPKQEKNK
jgi:hypothetical protein